MSIPFHFASRRFYYYRRLFEECSSVTEAADSAALNLFHNAEEIHLELYYWAGLTGRSH